jgi:hypothetical protein
VDETAQLHADVGPALAGPVATVFGALVQMGGAARDDEGNPKPIQPGDIGELLKRIDWPGVASAIQLLPKLLKQAAPSGQVSALYARILASTERARMEPTVGDGGAKGEIEVWGGLSTPAARDQAYGKGNIAELYKAVLSVLVVHIGPFGRSGLPLWSELSETLQGLLSLQRIPSSETTPPSTDSTAASELVIN